MGVQNLITDSSFWFEITWFGIKYVIKINISIELRLHQQIMYSKEPLKQFNEKCGWEEWVGPVQSIQVESS